MKARVSLNLPNSLKTAAEDFAEKDGGVVEPVHRIGAGREGGRHSGGGIFCRAWAGGGCGTGGGLAAGAAGIER